MIKNKKRLTSLLMILTVTTFYFTGCGSASSDSSNIDNEISKYISVYEIANICDENIYGDYFSVSSIRMSNVALTGGRRTTYDPYMYPLSAAEQAQRDFGYIGDEKKYIDISLEEE